MRVVVAWSVWFYDYEKMKTMMDRYTKKLKEVIVLHSNTRGHEKLIEKWISARWRENKTKYGKYEVYRPDFHKYAKPNAPLFRNEDMVRNADALIAFWDGEDEHVEDLIKRAKKHELLIKVVRFNNEED